MIPVVHPLPSQRMDLVVADLQTTDICDQTVPSWNSAVPENLAGKKQG